MALGVLCAVQGTVPAFAKEQEGSLKVKYATEDGAVTDMPMSLYYVGDKEGKDKVAWDEDFKGYRLYAKEMDSMPTVLQGYVQRDGIEADKTATTGETGVASFDGLKPGYYLAVGSPVEAGGVTLHMLPVLAYVGGENTEVAAEAKFERADLGQGPISISVEKEWDLKEETVKGEAVLKGSGQPKNVQADLMQDGELLETVKLSEKNGWSYTWEDLPSGHVYQVLETAVGEGFELSILHKDGTFTMTNHGVYTEAVSKNPPSKPKDDGNDKDKDKDKEKKDVTPSDATGSGSDSGNGTAGGAGNGNAASGEKLPQTGMLFWPIVVSVAGCGICGAAGAFYLRKGKRR